MRVLVERFIAENDSDNLVTAGVGQRDYNKFILGSAFLGNEDRPLKLFVQVVYNNNKVSRV